MAQIFPLNIDDLSPDGERVSLAGTLAALHDPWTLLRHRRVGAEEAEPVEVVLVHPEIGVALVDQAPRDPALSARRLREHLDQQRFGEFFPGDLPIVALSVAADEFEAIGERLEESPRDLYQRSPALDGSEPPLPLMVDWPFAASYERKRRRGWVAALVIIPLLLAGAGFAAWEYVGEDKTVATNDTSPPSQIEIPLPPHSRGDRAAGQPAASSPPPVPAAPPVVMAQKPYAPPPPAPPAPTPVEPLPQVTAAAPPNSPPAAEPAQPAPARMAATSPPDSGPAPQPTTGAPPAPQEEPPRTAATPPATPAKPTPGPAPSPAKPTRTSKAEPPPRPAAPARREPSLASRTRPIENPDRPPIDAADLPPLDEPPPAPQRPTPFAAPAGSSEPPGGALGPPVPLWRAQASNAAPSPAAAEPSTRECRPYTSSTTLTGRGLRVEGIACRGSDGQWRLVSEVPLR